MTYLKWAIAGLIGYTIMGPAISVAARRTNPDAALLISNVLFLIGVIAFVAYQGSPVLEYFVHPRSMYTYLAGVATIIGVIGYFRALSLGPVSVVVPIVGLFIVASTGISIVFLNEAFTLKKGAGIVLAVISIILVST